ncbi:RHO1 GDP-GTP exchange protein 2 [Ceratobasidium sp. 423]|nr:RHO1 GDP-GTP exchange protein 2 [Ceratobasidium sp. 423]
MLFGHIPLPVGKARYQLRFSSLGRRFNNSETPTLLSPNSEAANTWVETVNAQRDADQQTMESNVLKLGQDILQRNRGTKVNCAALYERSAFMFPLDALEVKNRIKDTKQIASHTSFFKVGTCMARTMICTIKGSSLSSTVKIPELVKLPPNLRGHTSLPDKEDKLKMFRARSSREREKYLAEAPRGIGILHGYRAFLKTKLCAAVASRFEIVDLETLDMQALLDPDDQKLKFAWHIEPHPVCMYRIGGEFLVCYKEFAFYVNSSGKKPDKGVIIYWEGLLVLSSTHTS